MLGSMPEPGSERPTLSIPVASDGLVDAVDWLLQAVADQAGLIARLVLVLETLVAERTAARTSVDGELAERWTDLAEAFVAHAETMLAESDDERDAGR